MRFGTSVSLATLAVLAIAMIAIPKTSVSQEADEISFSTDGAADLRTYNLNRSEQAAEESPLMARQPYKRFEVELIQGAKKSPKGKACKNEICAGLGNAFYLPGFNVLSHFTGGVEILQEKRLNRCALFNSVAQGTRKFSFRRDTLETMSSMSAEASVDGSYDALALTLDATVKTTTGYDVSSSTDVQALTLDITFQRGVLDYVQDGDCWSLKNLTPEFVKAFEALPSVDTPQSSASWVPYVGFLRAWGSHVMVQQTLGSRFQQWESVLKASRVSQKTLEAKACANVEGVTESGGGWSVKSCAAYSSDDRRASMSAGIVRLTRVVRLVPPRSF